MIAQAGGIWDTTELCEWLLGTGLALSEQATCRLSGLYQENIYHFMSTLELLRNHFWEC